MPSQASDAFASSKLCFAAASSASLSLDLPAMGSPRCRRSYRKAAGKSPLGGDRRRRIALLGGPELLQDRLDLPPAGVVELQFERLAVIRDGARILPDIPQRQGTAVEGGCDTRIEPDGIGEVRDRAIISPHPGVENT